MRVTPLAVTREKSRTKIVCSRLNSLNALTRFVLIFSKDKSFSYLSLLKVSRLNPNINVLCWKTFPKKYELGKEDLKVRGVGLEPTQAFASGASVHPLWQSA
ncbi:MAG: hypothetical protein K1T65_05290 [Candidatus Aramenus sp.]|nr:hypothetical protein [Candidatus Aramenus sp.]